MKKNSLIIAIVIILVGSISNADIFIFNTSDNPFDLGVKNQGWWGDTFTNQNINENYATGAANGEEVRNFFTFDLSSLNQIVLSATLELTRFDFTSSAESETVGFFDVTTDTAILNNNEGTSETIFSDLGSGSSYGQFIVSGSGSSSDILSFNLNVSAVNDITNAAGGWFSIGGSLLSIDGTTVSGDVVGNNIEAILNSVQGVESSTQRLVVETVPEPVILSFLGMGGIVLHRKQKI